MATARKLKSGSWRCLVYDYTDADGKRKYKSFTSSDKTAKGKRDAEYQAAQYVLDKEPAKKNVNKNTFATELKKYIELKRPVLSPSTTKSYLSILGVFESDFPDFYSMPVCDITQEHIQKVINKLSETKSPKTVKNYHGVITAVLGTRMIINTTLPQTVPPSLYIPTDSEVKKLVDVAKNTELEIPILLAAFCTMRRGEICGLAMDDIDGNTIHVHHSLVIGSDNEWHLKAPKTVSSDRYITAPEFVTERIEANGYITHHNPRSLTAAFRRVLERNNIPRFRFHDLRHYSASVQHALGIPDAYIMERGGWKSDKVLKSVYRHTMSDRQKEMNDKANSHFTELCNTKYNTKK